MKKVIYVLCNYRCLYKIEINQLERKSVQKLYPHLVRFGVGISDIYTKIDPDKAIGAI